MPRKCVANNHAVPGSSLRAANASSMHAIHIEHLSSDGLHRNPSLPRVRSTPRISSVLPTACLCFAIAPSPSSTVTRREKHSRARAAVSSLSTKQNEQACYATRL